MLTPDEIYDFLACFPEPPPAIDWAARAKSAEAKLADLEVERAELEILRDMADAAVEFLEDLERAEIADREVDDDVFTKLARSINAWRALEDD